MTSSIAFPHAAKKRWKVKYPKRFVREVASTLDEFAPEYRGVLDAASSTMIKFLQETLDHWSQRGCVPRRDRQMFRKTKIVEALAFWAGFNIAGGLLPPSIPHVEVPDLVMTRFQSPLPKSSGIAVVIPIGDTSQRIENIITCNLQTLAEHQKISTVYLVFDGVDPVNMSLPKLPQGKISELEIHPRSGPATARNAGVTAALRDNGTTGTRGVLFLDSDVSISRASLDSLLEECRMPPGIMCPRILAADTTWLNRYHDISGTLNGRYLLGDSGKQLLFGTTSCMFVPRDLFDEGIAFSTDFRDAAGEDIDFCLRARLARFPILAVDHVSVTHDYGYAGEGTADWTAFKARFRRYGAGEWLLLERHPWYYHALGKSIERI